MLAGSLSTKMMGGGLVLGVLVPEVASSLMASASGSAGGSAAAK